MSSFTKSSNNLCYSWISRFENNVGCNLLQLPHDGSDSQWQVQEPISKIAKQVMDEEASTRQVSIWLSLNVNLLKMVLDKLNDIFNFVAHSRDEALKSRGN